MVSGGGVPSKYQVVFGYLIFNGYLQAGESGQVVVGHFFNIGSTAHISCVADEVLSMCSSIIATFCLL
jgi:hypothetical protein